MVNQSRSKTIYREFRSYLADQVAALYSSFDVESDNPDALADEFQDTIDQRFSEVADELQTVRRARVDWVQRAVDAVDEYRERLRRRAEDAQTKDSDNQLMKLWGVKRDDLPDVYNIINAAPCNIVTDKRNMRDDYPATPDLRWRFFPSLRSLLEALRYVSESSLVFIWRNPSTKTTMWLERVDKRKRNRKRKK